MLNNQSGLDRVRSCVLILLLATVCGCGSSTDDFVFNTANQAAVATVANNDTFQALGNTPLTVDASQSVLTNDTGANVAVTSNTNPSNGTLAFNQANGTFVYTPNPGFRGPTDSFTYTLNGDGGTSQATVTINFGGFVVYVDSSAAGPGDGSFGSRFTTLAQAQAGSQANDTIFLFNGNGAAYGGGIVLANGQSLIGELSGFSFENQPRIDVVAGVGTRPTITNAAGNGIVLADSNTVTGLAVDNVAGHGIFGNANNSGTLTDIRVSNTTTDGLHLDSSTGTFTLSNINIDTCGEQGVEVRGNGGGTFNFDQLNVVNATIQGLLCEALDNGTLAITNSRIETCGNDGMRVNNGNNVTVSVLGTVITDVNNTCFSVTPDNGGTFNITLGGTGTGQAVELSNPGDGSIFCRGNAATNTFRLINTTMTPGARNANALGAFIPINGTHTLNLLLQGCTFNVPGNVSFQIALSATSNANVRMDGNTFNNNNGGFGLISNNGAGTVCYVAQNNTFTNAPFVDSNGAGSTFNIEPQVNNTPAITEGTGVTQVPAGTCPAIP